MREFWEYLGQWNEISVAVRLVLAAFFGSIIGIERGTKRRPAGMRTFALVCLGSALATITNIYLFTFGGTGSNATDLSRIPAGVVSGIGFLGVGMIIITGKNSVRGLTTAATLWVTATLGIAIGAGDLFSAILSFVLILIIVRVLAIVSRRQEQVSRIVSLYFELDRALGTGPLLAYIKQREFKVLSMDKQKKNKASNNDIIVIIELDLNRHEDHDLLVGEFGHLDCVKYAEEIK